MDKYLLSVPTSFGLEGLAAREIRKLGYATERVEDGRVSFFGDARAVCRSNIWLRFAERLQIKLGDFSALTFTELFDQTKALPWPELLPPDAAFPVNGHCLSSKLGSVPDCQSIIKKAAVESMKHKWKTERFNETGALYRISFNIIRDRVSIYVDTSGEGLHKRGYREQSALTPIRETLAAALVELSGWRPGKALWDPFCGSGTIVIEAAMLAVNRAPGLNRGFASEGWPMPAGAPGGWQAGAMKRLFEEERAAARAAYEKAFAEMRVKASAGAAPTNAAIQLAGSDLSRHCVQSARQNAAMAGVSPLVRFFQMDAKHMSPEYSRFPELGIQFPERGCIVTNPPYGERHDDQAAALDACREWAPALGAFRGWGWCIISALDNFERELGRPATKRRKLYNGRIKCQAYMYF